MKVNKIEVDRETLHLLARRALDPADGRCQSRSSQVDASTVQAVKVDDLARRIADLSAAEGEPPVLIATWPPRVPKGKKKA